MYCLQHLFVNKLISISFLKYKLLCGFSIDFVVSCNLAVLLLFAILVAQTQIKDYDSPKERDIFFIESHINLALQRDTSNTEDHESSYYITLWLVLKRVSYYEVRWC